MSEDLHRRLVYCILGPRRVPPGTDILALQRKRFREVHGKKMADALSAATCIMSMLHSIPAAAEVVVSISPSSPGEARGRCPACDLNTFKPGYGCEVCDHLVQELSE